jgi:hypothetical protein
MTYHSPTLIIAESVRDEVEAPVLPVQFAALWGGNGNTRTPEQRLALAMLERAIADLKTHRFARRRKRQRLFLEAYEWVASRDKTWPFSFVNVCRTLGLSSGRLRGALLELDIPRAAAA